jgi:glutathione S-transferase
MILEIRTRQYSGGEMIKQLKCAAAVFMMFATGAVSASAGTKSGGSQALATPLNITIYHLEGRRSERIVWLCEELGIPYKLEYKRGDLAGSMKTIHDVSPLMPVAPTVRINDQVMVESGAIIELILAREGHGRLEPAVTSPDYPYYLQWMHFAEGSFASRVIADYRVALIQGKPKTPAGGYKLVDTEAVLAFMEDFLSKHLYYGGSAFSAADIMMLFPTNITEAFNVADLTAYPHIIAWRTSVESRPAYKKMLGVARPDGIPGVPKPLPKD